MTKAEQKAEQKTAARLVQLAAKLGLTEKQRRLCEELVKDPERNQTRAALAAGYKGAGAKVNACNTLKKPEAQEYLRACEAAAGLNPQGAAAEAVEKTSASLITAERVKEELARLAFADLRDIFDDHGNLKPPKEWPERLAGAIASVEVLKKNVTTGDGKIDDIHKVRVWDKTRALEMLAKHLGLLTEKVEHSGALEITWKNSEL